MPGSRPATRRRAPASRARSRTRTTRSRSWSRRRATEGALVHVVVLGAGVVGVTTAWQLLEDGHEVTVIDRQPAAARETSFANAGHVAVGHALPWANPRALRTLVRSLLAREEPL